MNKVIEIGRLTRDPDVRYGGSNNICVARFSIAVPRKKKAEGGEDTDFFNCVAFGNTGEFIEKYFTKGMKIVIEGHLQSGSYTNKDGQKVSTVEIVCDSVEFGESKSTGSSASNTSNSGSNTSKKSSGTTSKKSSSSDDFMNLEDLDELDEELPFN